MGKIAIECQGIKKHYGQAERRVEALRGVDLAIETEALTLLIGPSGSGKTTLLSIISAILTPDEGQIRVLDKELMALTDNEKSRFCSENIGIVFQSLFLIPTLSVEENIALPLLVLGSSHRRARAKAREQLESFRLERYADSSPADLSKGQQQRVAIARALVHGPAIVICDEPTSALDHATGMEIMKLLKEIALQQGKAVLVVTHDHRIFAFADRMISMSDGLIEGETIYA